MRKDLPTGSEIAEKAKRIKFDNRKDIQGDKDGKKVRFKGADLSHMKSLDELEAGQVIGVLETELSGDETTLPAGTHNLFLSNIDGRWRVHAESGGKVVAEAVRVTVIEDTVSARKQPRPRFAAEGWCLFEICLYEIWGFCIVRVGILCF